jgi:hypothetical protein
MSFTPPPKKQKKALMEETDVELDTARRHHCILMEWYEQRQSMKKTLTLFESHLKDQKVDLQDTTKFTIGYFTYMEHLVVNDSRIVDQAHLDRFVLYIHEKAKRCRREMYERHVQIEKEGKEQMELWHKKLCIQVPTPISTIFS